MLRWRLSFSIERTFSYSFFRSNPVLTKTPTRPSPIARETKITATVESTPPLIANAVDGRFDERVHRPISSTSAYIKDETAQQCFSVFGVGNLGMKLNTEN